MGLLSPAPLYTLGYMESVQLVTEMESSVRFFSLVVDNVNVRLAQNKDNKGDGQK